MTIKEQRNYNQMAWTFLSSHIVSGSGCSKARLFRQTFTRIQSTADKDEEGSASGGPRDVLQQFFPPAPYPLEPHETATFEKLIAEAVHKKLPVDANGHINRRLGNKLLRAAFAPPGDPHESYLIKDESPLKKGRTKEFGYVCTCWRGAAEVCKGCAKKRREELELRDRPWKPSYKTKAMMERSKEINRKK